MVSKGSPTPLYHQIYLVLRDRIAAGQLEDVLTEAEIAAQYGVSRITAKRALDELAAQGLVTRQRRTGTRVAAAPSAPRIQGDLASALDSLLAHGRRTAVVSVNRSTVEADAVTATLLGLKAGAPVSVIERVRALDGAPIGVVQSLLPVALAADVADDRLRAQPLLTVLADLGHQPSRARQWVSAQLAGPELQPNWACRWGLPSWKSAACWWRPAATRWRLPSPATGRIGISWSLIFLNDWSAAAP
jgi:GntR family transcriptional regulator